MYLTAKACGKVNKNLMFLIKQPVFWIIGYIRDCLVLILWSDHDCPLDLHQETGTLSGPCDADFEMAGTDVFFNLILGPKKKKTV